MRTEYHVQRPTADGNGYITICVALTPEAAGHLVSCLLGCDLRGAADLRILIVPCQPAL